MTTRGKDDAASSAAETRALLKKLLRERVTKQTHRTASFGQQRLWIVDQIVPGTPGYMAPEQLDGAADSPASDQYALASTVYEVLSGHLP